MTARSAGNAGALSIAALEFGHRLTELRNQAAAWSRFDALLPNGASLRSKGGAK